MTALPSPRAALAWAIEQAEDYEQRTRAAAERARPRAGRPDHPAEMWAVHGEYEAILTGLRAVAAAPGPDMDALLLELADAGVRQLSLECRPSRSRSLYVAVWRQDGRKHRVEARSVGAVLRRVLRAARTVSGDTGVKGQVA